MASKNPVKDKEREFLIECIELYRNLPALWQIKSKLYQDRDKKNMAYDLLLAKYNEMFPQATKEILKKKINSLRTNYRKELKKHVNSMKSGASTDSIYIPTLWYFEEMNFLRDQELPIDSESSMYTHKIAKFDGDEDNDEQRPGTRTPTDEIQDSTLGETPPRTTSKKAKRNEQLNGLAYERLNELKDGYYHWGMAYAADLRKMERSQQFYAKKAIAEVIMEGQLGLLHRHSVKINENLPFSSVVQYGASPSPQYSNHAPSPSYNKSTTPPPHCRNPIPSPTYRNSTPPSPSYLDESST